MCEKSCVSNNNIVIRSKTMNTWLAMLLEQVVKQISPEIRKGMIEFVLKMEEQAKATPNPWDDIFVGIVKFVLVIK